MSHIIKKAVDEDDGHQWSAIECECDLAIEDDAFFTLMVDKVRKLYGEYLVKNVPEYDPSIKENFNVDLITEAIRMAMPNPAEEGNKPVQLTNYRSESAEIVAQLALEESYGVLFPVGAQVAKGNANQPILGFDGWGLLEIDNSTFALVLVQVKGSDDKRRPPGVANILIDECCNAPTDLSKICRALTSLLSLLQDETLELVVYSMLELMGKGRLPHLILAPVIVRGIVAADMQDLASLRASVGSFSPATCKGACISIGNDLNQFGEAIFKKAREK